MPVKWIDNVLSHHSLPGVIQSRQGIARRLTPQAIATLELTLRLNRALGTPIGYALDIAQQLMQSPAAPPAVVLDGDITLTFDLADMWAQTAARLAHAVEVAPVRRRGRPPLRR